MSRFRFLCLRFLTALLVASVTLLALGGLSPVLAQSGDDTGGDDTGGGTGDGEVSDDDVNRVAKDMFCPTCENTPLDVCPTQTCQDWRDLIEQQLEAGWTEDEIHIYFADTFGDHVLAEPPRRGFDILAWIIPILGVLVGAGLFYRWMGRLRAAAPESSGAPAAPATNPPPDDYMARIEQELRERQ
jgi:cytochrome c-type biogenesis protein CcmH